MCTHTHTCDCIQYANACRDPTEIFNYLNHRQIGLNYALYYEARAAYYELKGKHNKALDTYQEGIDRLAQPRGRLQSKLEEFQHRMHQRIQRKMRREREGGTPAAGGTGAADERITNEEEAPERPALAGVRQLGLGASTSSCAGGASGYARGGDAPTNAQSNRNRQLEIFEESPRAARRDGNNDQGHKVLWTNLGSQAATKRENQQQPSSWNTFRFPQQGGRAAAGPALDIPMDDDLVASENAGDPSTAEIPRTASDPQLSRPAFDPAIGYDARLLQGPDGNERSFEEARAESWIATHGIPQPLPNTAVPPASMRVELANLTGAAAVDAVQVDEAVQEDEGPSNAGAAANTEATIHTREAFADIMSMFSERLPCDDDENMPKRKRKQGLSSSPVAKTERATLAGPLGAATHAGGASTDFHIFDDAEEEAAPAAAAAVQTKAAAPSPAQGQKEEEQGPSSSLFVYEDTAVLNVNIAGTDAGRGGDVGVGASIANAETNAAPMLAVYDDEHEVAPPDRENQCPAAAAHSARALPARTLGERDVDEAVLHPLSDERMDALAVTVDDTPLEHGVDEDGNPILVHPETLLRTAGERAHLPVAADMDGKESVDDVKFDSWYDSMRSTMVATPRAADAHTAAANAPVHESVVDPIPASTTPAASTIATTSNTRTPAPPAPPPPMEPIDDDALINPFDAELCSIVIENQDPPLSIGRIEEANTAGDARTVLGKVQKSGRPQTIFIRNEEIAVEHVLGKGAYAVVYRALVARTSDAGDREWAGVQEDDSVTCMEVALKVQSSDEIAPSWEMYIGREICSRMGSFSRSEYLVFHEMHSLGARDEDKLTLLIGRCANHGSLQQLLNAYLKAGTAMDEVIVMYYTMDLLRIVGALHAIGLQHGDIKPDNLMLRNDSDGWEEWAPGRHGTWEGKGLSLCDWGRAIDMRALDGGPFRPDALPDSFRTFGAGAEPDRPWTFAADAYGVCGVVHCMLFGKYMTLEVAGVDANGSKLYRPTEPMKRTHQVELWHTFFDLLLNPEPGEAVPPMQNLHDRFESYISSDEARRKSVKKQLMKQNIMMMNQ